MNPSESIYGKLNFESHWYALKTRYRHEKKVNERLQRKGVTSYLPLYSTNDNWNNRKKKVTEPLFSCYVFVKIPLKERLPVLQTEGAIRLVSFNNVPAPIPENQIDAIRQILQENMSFQKENYLALGKRVEVIHGPLKGIKGIVQKIKDQSRLVISIDFFQQSFSVNIDAEEIKLID